MEFGFTDTPEKSPPYGLGLDQFKTSLPVVEQEDDEQTETLPEDVRDEESGQSEDENEACLQPEPSRKPAWVDEDDELEEE